jgi:hypothetical protein
MVGILRRQTTNNADGVVLQMKLSGNAIYDAFV